MLSNFTANQLVELIDLCLVGVGVSVDLYTPEYGTLRQEVLDPTATLYDFKPQTVFLASNWRDLSHVANLADNRGRVEELLELEYQHWATLWDLLHKRLGCQIIQNNFDCPPWRQLDNYEMRHHAGLANFITRFNQLLQERAPPFVTLHDIDHLQASAGRWTWGDDRFFHLAKLPCAPECQVDYAHSLASVVAAQLGRSKKCLVLDLDNTLWGGVIGDDGLGGIRLGQGDPEGEAYLGFQRYIRALRSRGVILAVCSKNEDRIAREVFEKHTEMVLRPADISCFVANWSDKASNLRTIAKRLNIGLDSLVFVDDNPAERALVRQLVPEVAVPELPPDPAEYVRVLERHRYFQTTSLGAEDMLRTEYYQANRARQEEESGIEDLNQFLRSLQMVARIEPIVPATLERSTQLINKSNQFNLTTRRYSAAQVLAMSQDESWVTRTVSLADRFGDNGLISVVLGRRTEDVLEIDTWLMSCRVLKRGVEKLLLNHLALHAIATGLTSLRGEYIPTPKNDLVRDHYASLGFTKTSDGSEGRSCWELKLDDGWAPFATFIEEPVSHGSTAAQGPRSVEDGLRR